MTRRLHLIPTVFVGMLMFLPGCASRPGNSVAQPEPAETVIVYEPTWESLQQYTVPQWFSDVKFGIFIHWGVYSVPAFSNEWYPRNMYREEHMAYAYHRENFGGQSKFGYKNFIPRFKGENWDPEVWADLFQKSGAKYVVPVAEHHDGFPMYDCSYTTWDAVARGPQRDIITELGQAVRRRGLKFGVSTHRAHNWFYYPHNDAFDTNDPENTGLYGPAHGPDDPPSEGFITDWYNRTVELIDKFQPDVLWFDFGFNREVYESYRQRIAAYYYNQANEWGKGVVLQYKREAFPKGAAVLDLERGKLKDIRKMTWQTDTSVGKKSWGYIQDEEYKSVDDLVDDLVDIVSKNGCLLLNIGPRPDGTIPAEQQRILLEMGDWLEVNGEAIYGTRPWKIFGEGPTEVIAGHMSERQGEETFTDQDVRFTTKDDVLYVIALGWPVNGVTVRALGSSSDLSPGEIADITQLGSDTRPQWSHEEDGLVLKPMGQASSAYANTFKITFKDR